MVHTPGDLRASVDEIDSRDRDKAQLRREIMGTGSLVRASSVGDLAANASSIGNMRRISGHRKLAAGAGDIALAIPRFYDPMEYWDLSGFPWNMADEGHRHKLHKWMRLYYDTHYLIATLIDIFTRFPLGGLELYSKDKKLTAFYEDAFLDQLDYEDFLVQLGKEYWLIGEAFPYGSFNETLGIWEFEELLNPEDIAIENFKILGRKEPEFKVVPPEYLKRLVRTRQPSDMYKQLEINWPEIIPRINKGDKIPISNVLLKQVAFKTMPWADHGTPILLRGLRTLMHEEKLMASQDAIAERLYSPLILAKLGIQDMGPNMPPWLPTQDQLDAFRDEMDVALSQDFRLIVHHFGLDVQNVFGREQVPDLGEDFDRIERRLMQVFGVNPSLLSAGTNSQPYASSALQAEFMNQVLRTFQKYLKGHFKSRALVVAEANEHFDYEKRGSTRVPIMEDVVIIDEETGEPHIERRHKYIVPDMNMQTLDMRDEATQRQFLQVLRAQGVPISDERLMIAVPFKFKDSLDEMQEEMIQKTVAQQMAKMQTYKILLQQGLSIPAELKAEIEGMNAPAAGGAGALAPGGAPPPSGVGDMGAPGSVDVGAPGAPGGIVMPPPPAGMGAGTEGVVTQPGGPAAPEGNSPQISNERRPGMPQFASVEEELADLDVRIGKANDILIGIEVNKRVRMSKMSNRTHMVQDEKTDSELPWDFEAPRTVESKVTPAARKNIEKMAQVKELPDS